MRTLLKLTFFAASITAAHASSPDAWNDLYRTTGEACLKQSGLKKPRLVEGPTTFAHAVLYKVQGRWPQSHMKNKIGRVYCLHPYPDGAPEIVDVPNASATGK
jgi:hypothetical protein